MRRTHRIARRLTGAFALVAATTLVLAGCGTNNPLDNGSGGASSARSGDIVVGSANFAESEILANVYTDALADNGVKATVKPDIGARDAYIAALKDGSIDLVPEYTGNLLQYFDSSATAASPDDVYDALAKAVPSGYTVLDKAPAQDADSFNVTRAFSEKNGITSIADLAKLGNSVKVAAPPEFSTRPYGIPGLKSQYGIDASLVPINDGGGPSTVKALTDGQVQFADIYTTSPAIAQNDLVTLTDPKNMILAQNVVPLVNAGKADDKVRQTLDKVQASLTTADLVAMNTKSSVGKQSAADIAKAWLQQKQLFG